MFAYFLSGAIWAKQSSHCSWSRRGFLPSKVILNGFLPSNVIFNGFLPSKVILNGLTIRINCLLADGNLTRIPFQCQKKCNYMNKIKDGEVLLKHDMFNVDIVRSHSWKRCPWPCHVCKGNTAPMISSSLSTYKKKIKAISLRRGPVWLSGRRPLPIQRRKWDNPHDDDDDHYHSDNLDQYGDNDNDSDMNAANPKEKGKWDNPHNDDLGCYSDGVDDSHNNEDGVVIKRVITMLLIEQ